MSTEDSVGSQSIVNLDEANGFFGQHKYEKAIESYLFALAKCQSIDCNQSPEINYQLGQCFIFSRNSDSSIVYFGRSLIEARKFKNDKYKEESLLSLGEIFMIRSEYKRTLQYLQEGIKLTEKRNDFDLMPIIYSQIGTSFRKLGDVDSALYYLEISMSLVDKIKDRKTVPSILKGMADFHADLTNYEEAQNWYLEVLDELRIQKDSIGISAVLMTIAEMFLQQDQYDRAEEYLLEALEMTRVQNLRIRNAMAKTQLAKIFIHNNQYNDARDNLLFASEIFVSVKQQSRLGRAKMLLAEVSIAEKKFELAIDYYNECIQIYENTNDFEGRLSAKIGRANVYALNKKPDRAIKEINLVLDEVQTRQTPNLEMEAYEILSDCYSAQGHYREAYFYQDKYQEIRNRLFNKQRSEALNNTDKKYNIALKEKEILSLQNHQILQESKISRARLINLGLILAGVFFAILAFIYFQYYKNSKLIGLQRRELDAQKIKTLEKENRLAKVQSMMQGQEYERERIAKDLHDGLGGLLSTIKIQFDGLEEEDKDLEESHQFQKTTQLLDEACDEVRRIAHNMVPEIITQLGLIEALEDLTISLKRKGLKIHLQTFNLETDLDEEFEKTIYRIVQELFSNIIKHAKATEVIVQLIEREEKIELIVEDNGEGFEYSDEAAGMGIRNIRSRIDFYNGEYNLESEIGEGVTVTITLPIIQQAN